MIYILFWEECSMKTHEQQDKNIKDCSFKILIDPILNVVTTILYK